MAIERTLQLKLMVSKEEMQTVRDLADAAGVSIADYVRSCIREKAREAKEAKTIAGRLGAFADKLERMGVPRRETARLRIPTMAEMARQGFAAARRADERQAKKKGKKS